MVPLLPARSATMGTAKRVKELTPYMVATTSAPVASDKPCAPHNIGQVHDEDGMAGTPPVVDTNEVPEGEGAPGLLEEVGRPHPRAKAVLQRVGGAHADWRPGGASPSSAGSLRKKGMSPNRSSPPTIPGAPERPAPAHLGQEHHHQGRKQHVGEALRRL